LTIQGRDYGPKCCQKLCTGMRGHADWPESTLLDTFHSPGLSN